MDWQHASSPLTQSLIPLLAIVAASALAAWLAGLPDIQHAAWAVAVPHTGFAAVALLVLPSTAALRQRWLGLMHLATLAATALLWFICVASIAHDSP